MPFFKANLLRFRKDEIAENVLRRFLGDGFGRKPAFRDRFVIAEYLQKSREIKAK